MATRRPPARRRVVSRDTRRPARPSPLRLVRLEDRCVPANIVAAVAGEPRVVSPPRPPAPASP